jgi:hypothetical protein
MEDDDYGWEEIYQAPHSFHKYVGDVEHLQEFKRFWIYYNTFGGGPEGGYILNGSGDLWYVERTWGEPFKATLMEGKTLDVKTSLTEDECVKYVKVVDKDE